MADYKKLVEFMARALVNSPDDVEVDADGEDLTLSVNQDDRGRIIGKNGRTAWNIRAVLTAAGRGNEEPTLNIAD